MHPTRIRVLRRIPALALAAALALSVAACTDDEPPSAEPTNPPIGEGPGETASPSPSPTPEPSPSPTVGLTMEQAQEIITEIQERVNNLRVDLYGGERTAEQIRPDLLSLLTEARVETFMNEQELTEQFDLTDRLADPPGPNVVTIDALPINRPGCVVAEASADVSAAWRDPLPVEINPILNVYVALVPDADAPLGWRESRRSVVDEGETSASTTEAAECDN